MEIRREVRRHKDLWRIYDWLMQQRRSMVCFVKVKGYASSEDVCAGRVEAIDKEGNDGADELAVAGAALHAISDEARGAAQRQRILAEGVQRNTFTILQDWEEAQEMAQREHRAEVQAAELEEVPVDASVRDHAGFRPGFPGEAEPG